MEKMSYKNYIFTHNPEQIVIEEEKNIKEFILPFYGNVLQNCGRKKRIVSGKGELFGENPIAQFQELRNVYESQGTGYLKLPNIPAFLAIFRSLKMTGQGNENIITYSFEFWEQITNESTAIEENEGLEHTVLDGETLWSISSRYDTSVSALLAANEDIKRPDELTAGQKVKIK